MAELNASKPAKPIRAFSVQETDEMTGGIVFARHAIVARKYGANEYADGELSYVTCRRAPWADEFADQGDVPIRIAVQHGWHFECDGCAARLDEYGADGDSDEEEAVAPPRPASGFVGTMRTSVYCCEACRIDTRNREAARKAFGADVVDRLKDQVRQRFGDVEFVTATFEEHAYVTGGGVDPFTAEQVFVSFKFPGMKYGPASLRWETDKKRQVWKNGRWRYDPGPAAPEYSVCNGDLEAWNAFKAPVPLPSPALTTEGA